MKNTLTILSVSALLLLFSTCAKVNPFHEPPDHPVIDSLAPASGTLGTRIRLWGSGFSTRPSLDTVRINGVLVRVDSPSTSTVLLVTIIDSTGTGPVHVTVNDKSANGPVFTYLGKGDKEAPLITGVEFGGLFERGYAVSVKTLPATDNGIRLLVGGVSIPIYEITRAGSAHYDSAKGHQIMVYPDTGVVAHAEGIYANFVVEFNGVRSAPYPFQMRPLITDLTSRNGKYVFAAGDTITITGNFFGDQTLPSLFYFFYYGQPLSPLPRILSWKNTEITAITPAYSSLPINSDIPLFVKVGEKESPSTRCKYIGVIGGTVSLIAGSDQGNVNGSEAAAKFNAPAGLAVDASGNLYVADQGNNSIRRITNMTSSGGDVTTLAGSTAGFNDSRAAVSLFNQPAGVAVDANGTVYVADMNNNRIRMISGGLVSTFAGDGTPSIFSYPTGVAINTTSNVAYVADMNNNRIRAINNTILFTLAGGAAGYTDGSLTAAQFNQPYGVAVGPDGSVYIADGQNHAIRKIGVDGVVSTLAGGSNGKADGAGTAAQFELPRALALDAQGNVYVADFFNPNIRKITPQGVVTTITGVFADGSGFVNFSAPAGIAIDGQGNIYVSDAGTHRIYKMILK